MDESFILDGDITKAKKEADKRRVKLTDDIIRQMRIRCKNDPFFLGSLLGYELLSINLHGELCVWMVDTRDKWQYRLLLLPRGHYKSTTFTVIDSVQTALPDDLGNSPYPYNLGTNVRLLIAHDIAEMSQKFLRIITQQFCMNPILISLFPECVPDTKRHRINIKELELPRTAAWGESTFDTMGVGARGQGNHYNKLKLDDIYGETARDSKSERESHIQWFDNIQSFLLTPDTDKIDIAGTRWAYDDVYGHAIKTYGDQLTTFIRGFWARDKDGKIVYNKDGERQTIFPEQFTAKKAKILQKNTIVWNAQYLNDPREGSAKFNPEWKRFYNRIGRDFQIVNSKSFLNDGSVEEIAYESLDRLILVDPALEGLSGIAVTGTDKHKRTFIIEAIKKSLPPEQLRDLIFSLVAKYNPRLVAIEEVLFSALFEHWFRAEMTLRGVRFRIEPVKTKQKAKELRVAGLANYFEAGQIYFDPNMDNLIEEFDQFGATDDYHILDALAYGPRLWRAGSMWTTSTKEITDEGRSILTGYSRYR